MITIVLPVSRTTFINQVMHSLESLNMEANLLVYVDDDLKAFEKWRNAVTRTQLKKNYVYFAKEGKQMKLTY